MTTRDTLLSIIGIGWRRLVHEGVFTISVDDFAFKLTGKDGISECSDSELFALVRTMFKYDAFDEVKICSPCPGNVIELRAVTGQALLGMGDQDFSRLRFYFGAMSETKGLEHVAAAGLLDAWNRLLMLWETSQAPASRPKLVKPRRRPGAGRGKS